MLDLIGMLAIAGTLGAVLVTIGGATTTSAGRRVRFGVAAGFWIGAVAALTTSGLINKPVVLLSAFAIPMLLAVGAARFSRGFRGALGSIPAPTLIALNSFRVIGVLFLLLAAAGRLGGPFPYFAGIGDIIAGLFALRIAGLARRVPLSDPRILAWNAFGLLDLLVAIGLGLISRSGPLQLIHIGAGSAAMGTLPWAYIPLVLVPAFMVGHVTIFRRARLERATAQGMLGTPAAAG